MTHETKPGLLASIDDHAQQGEVASVAARIAALRAVRQLKGKPAPAKGESEPPAPAGSMPASAGDDSENTRLGQSVAMQIEKLRAHRVKPLRDPDAHELIARIQRDMERTQQRLGDLIDVWTELVPAHLEPYTQIIGFRAGVAHVRVDTSAVSYELDRLLREGLLAELRSRCPATLTRIRVRVGKAEEPEQGRGGSR